MTRLPTELIWAGGVPVACMAWSSAPRHIGCRDQFIGWSAVTRRQNINLLAYNTRFLILPWARVPHLASHILAVVARRISADWIHLYHHPVWFLETFVDPERFRGTCYRAANWIFLGLTTGVGKASRTNKPDRSLKECLGYPLSAGSGLPPEVGRRLRAARSETVIYGREALLAWMARVKAVLPEGAAADVAILGKVVETYLFLVDALSKARVRLGRLKRWLFGSRSERIGEVYRVDDLAKERRLSAEDRLLLHQEKSGPVMDSLRRWLADQLLERITEPNSELGLAIRYVLRLWEPLTEFLRVPGVPLDNNPAERILKAAIRHRKNACSSRRKGELVSATSS